MDSRRDHASNIVASAAGNTVSPAVTALIATASIVTRNPELALLAVPAGAFAGAATEEGLQLVAGTLHDRTSPIQQLADSVSDATGRPIEEWIASSITDSPRRELLGLAVDAAANARSEWKIRILADALIEGVSDASLVEVTVMYVRLMRQLDVPDMRLLSLLYDNAKAERANIGGRRSLETIFEWLVTRDPGLKDALPFLYKHSSTLGLIETYRDRAGTFLSKPDETELFLQLTPLGLACLRWLSRFGQELPASGG